MTSAVEPAVSEVQSRVRDLIAGLSIAGLLLPEAVAYASIANVPPQMAVIALFAGLACYALLGSSRFAIVSATSSSAAVLAAVTGSIANGDTGLRLALCIGLVILTGLFFLLASVAKLGGITDFIAKPVLRGFAFGLAIVIILKQLPKVVGVNPASSDLWRFAFELFERATNWNLHRAGDRRTIAGSIVPAGARQICSRSDRGCRARDRGKPMV